jgi:hypothetical protein
MNADKILIRIVIEWRADLDAVAGQLANYFPQSSGLFAGHGGGVAAAR